MINRNHKPNEQFECCENCGNEKRNTQRKSVKFCSRKCEKENIRKMYLERWRRGEETGNKGITTICVSRHIRLHLFEKHNNACQKCGWSVLNTNTNLVPLEIHHIDGNCVNSKEENLELLCPNCHALTKNFRAKNIKGRRKLGYRK
jgi:hypothetical protein